MRKPFPSSLISIIALSLLMSACGHKKINTGSAETGGKKGLLVLSAEWVKDKGTKYDLNFEMRNESDKDIIVMLNDMECSQGDQHGVLKHTFFNTGERTIDFRKGQTKRFLMVCDLGVKAVGAYKITVNRVYDNPESDGAQKGKVIAKDLVWTFDNHK